MDRFSAALQIACLSLFVSLIDFSQGIGYSSPNITEILDTFLIGYDRRVRPNYGGEPVKIKVGMHVLDIQKVSSANMDFTMTFYFRQKWIDNRLEFPLKYKHSLKDLILGSEYSQEIWLPDTFFVSEILAKYHNVPAHNDFLRIQSNGQVLRSIRMTVTTQCKMNLRDFPFDVQNCNLDIESYGFQMKDVIYEWMNVTFTKEILSEDFKLLGHKKSDVHAHLTTGNYSRLSAKMYFRRESNYYIAVYMIPVVMFVSLAFMSMWIRTDLLGSRLGLALGALIGITAISNLGLQTVQRVPYVKLMDIFMGVSFLAVFSIILESIIVAGLNPKTRSGSFVDYICRLTLPGFYAVFHVVFWMYGFASQSAHESIIDIHPF